MIDQEKETQRLRSVLGEGKCWCGYEVWYGTAHFAAHFLVAKGTHRKGEVWIAQILEAQEIL